MPDARRGEVWGIRFDPSEGDEIRKIRPAVVMTAHSAGRMQLHIVAPITSGRPITYRVSGSPLSVLVYDQGRVARRQKP